MYSATVNLFLFPPVSLIDNELGEGICLAVVSQFGRFFCALPSCFPAHVVAVFYYFKKTLFPFFFFFCGRHVVVVIGGRRAHAHFPELVQEWYKSLEKKGKKIRDETSKVSISIAVRPKRQKENIRRRPSKKIASCSPGPKIVLQAPIFCVSTRTHRFPPVLNVRCRPKIKSEEIFGKFEKHECSGCTMVLFTVYLTMSSSLHLLSSSSDILFSCFLKYFLLAAWYIKGKNYVGNQMNITQYYSFYLQVEPGVCKCLDMWQEGLNERVELILEMQKKKTRNYQTWKQFVSGEKKEKPQTRNCRLLFRFLCSRRAMAEEEER